MIAENPAFVKRRTGKFCEFFLSKRGSPENRESLNTYRYFSIAPTTC